MRGVRFRESSHTEASWLTGNVLKLSRLFQVAAEGRMRACERPAEEKHVRLIMDRPGSDISPRVRIWDYVHDIL